MTPNTKQLVWFALGVAIGTYVVPRVLPQIIR